MDPKQLILNQLFKSSVKIEKALESWDLKTCLKEKVEYNSKIEILHSEKDAFIAFGDKEIEETQISISGNDYKKELEIALRGESIPIEGDFPNYYIPPFKLTISIDEKIIKLTYGRRVEKMYSFKPEVIANWVKKNYQGLINRPFNDQQFSKDILSAYEIANKLRFQQQNIQWGRPVGLKMMHKLLTLRSATRKEYPIIYFAYDISRFREGELTYDGRRFEFGTSRDIQDSILVRNKEGQEDRLSTLTIY